MTKAGYIHDQRCPTNPEHGNVYALEEILFCPHSDHSSGKEGFSTKSRWSYSEWEAVKTGEDGLPKSPKDPQAHPSRARTIQVRKPNARPKRRRRPS